MRLDGPRRERAGGEARGAYGRDAGREGGVFDDLLRERRALALVGLPVVFLALGTAVEGRLAPRAPVERLALGGRGAAGLAAPAVDLLPQVRAGPEVGRHAREAPAPAEERPAHEARLRAPLLTPLDEPGHGRVLARELADDADARRPLAVDEERRLGAGRRAQFRVEAPRVRAPVLDGPAARRVVEADRAATGVDGRRERVDAVEADHALRRRLEVPAALHVGDLGLVEGVPRQDLRERGASLGGRLAGERDRAGAPVRHGPRFLKRALRGVVRTWSLSGARSAGFLAGALWILSRAGLSDSRDGVSSLPE